MDFAIIGAGMAGLTCADFLHASGHSVALFDKGRGPGGRMSTRRMETALGQASFDHGAQYFTTRDPEFRRVVGTWADEGAAAPWPAAGTDAWVGVPGMNAIVKQMASHRDVEWSRIVTGLTRRGGEWHLLSERGTIGPFGGVVLAIPAEQAAAMLSLHDFAMARAALAVRSQPCWTGMFAFDRPLDCLPPIIREVGDIAWAARNSAKPGRSQPEAWVVQASAAWSAANLELRSDEIAELLLAALSKAAGAVIPRPIAAQAHRWRFAVSAGTGDGALWNPDLRLGVCGDWLLGPSVECAWLSGRMLAHTKIGSSTDPEPGPAPEMFGEPRR